jgi:hypothetical protein
MDVINISNFYLNSFGEMMQGLTDHSVVSGAVLDLQQMNIKTVTCFDLQLRYLDRVHKAKFRKASRCFL